MANKSGIYKITSKVNGKIYIGSAVDFNKRKIKHLSEFNRQIHPNKKLQNHVNKYGIDDLEFSVIEVVTNKEDLIIRKQHHFDTLSPDFNICKVAGSALGRKWSESMREKMASKISVLKGKSLTEETKRKMSEVRKGKGVGRRASVETIAKMREYGLTNPVNYWSGKKRSEETKEKFRSSHLGKKASEETKKKMSEKRKGKKPYIMTDETRKKLSEYMKGRKRGPYKKKLSE